jgi:hypothetical protein
MNHSEGNKTRAGRDECHSAYKAGASKIDSSAEQLLGKSEKRFLRGFG